MTSRHSRVSSHSREPRLPRLDLDSPKLLYVNVPSNQTKMRSMPQLGAYLLGAAIAMVSCSQTTSLQTAADTATTTLKHRIPPADPAKYRTVVDAREWQTPYLMVQAKGIDARPISAATETPTMSPGGVVAYLEKLPSIAWPYPALFAKADLVTNFLSLRNDVRRKRAFG